MAYRYISLPITLASVKLIGSIDRELYHYHTLVCYSIVQDTMGFTAMYSPEDEEYMCESEEEFHKLVGEYRLLRMLWNLCL